MELFINTCMQTLTYQSEDKASQIRKQEQGTRVWSSHNRAVKRQYNCISFTVYTTCSLVVG